MPIARAQGWPYRHPPNTSFGLNSASPQARGLVTWFTSISGHLIEHVLDASITLENEASFTPRAEIGYMLDLDGSNDSVSVASHDSFTLSPTIPFSISYWCYSTNDAYSRVLSKTPQSSRPGWIVYQTADYPYFGAWGATSGFIEARTNFPAQVPENNLYNITVTYDGSNSATGLRFYINGIYYVSLVSSDNSVGNWTNSNNLLIGRDNTATPSSYWTGYLGDIRIYNYQISDGLAWDIYAPNTRWELYRPGISRFWSIPVTPVEDEKVIYSKLIRSNQIPIHQLQL